MKGGPRAACCTWLSRRAAYWFRLRLKTVWLVCDVGRKCCFRTPWRAIFTLRPWCPSSGPPFSQAAARSAQCATPSWSPVAYWLSELPYPCLDAKLHGTRLAERQNCYLAEHLQRPWCAQGVAIPSLAIFMHYS